MDTPDSDRSDIDTTPEPKKVGSGNLIAGGKKGLRRPSKLLGDMRWVYTHKKIEGEELSPGKQQCRELQEKDSIEFLRMLNALERTHGASARRANTTEKDQPDESEKPGRDLSSERVEALCEELLAGFEAEEAARTGRHQ